jgi:hypothetical protein
MYASQLNLILFINASLGGRKSVTLSEPIAVGRGVLLSLEVTRLPVNKNLH